MTYIAAQTGAAATYVTVTTQSDSLTSVDKDVLMVARLPTDTALDSNKTVFAEQIISSLMPADITSESNKRLVQVDAFNYTSDKQAAILGFESPLTKNRSVVALLSLPGNGSRALITKLSHPGSMADAQGSLSYVAGDTCVNFHSSQTYYISDLPWYQSLWLYFLNRPGLLFSCVMLALFLAIIVITVVMKRVVAKRMHDQKKVATAIKVSR